MNRLQSELHRLYLPHAAAGQGVVLELARPAAWAALSNVWRGVQADLNLPAPAIAVNGADGYQLWFSLPAPVAAAQALAFVESLRQRYLGDIAPGRVGIRPVVDLEAMAPPRQTQSECWSAFVAADLAPVFADEPWIDTPPGPEGQADLLCRLACIKDADFRVALDLLGPATAPVLTAAPAGVGLDPRTFLRQVMNDETLALGLRIEAAKALLPGPA